MENDYLFLLHLSFIDVYENRFELFEPREEFFLRIPESISIEGEEDETIPRICTSTRIDYCLKAMGGRLPHYLFLWSDSEVDPYFKDELERQRWVLLDHNFATGFLVRGYEFQVKKEHVVFPRTLLEKSLVPDVQETNEHWILQNTQPVRSFFVLVQNSFIKDGKTCYNYLELTDEELGRTVQLCDFLMQETTK